MNYQSKYLYFSILFLPILVNADTPIEIIDMNNVFDDFDRFKSKFDICLEIKNETERNNCFIEEERNLKKFSCFGYPLNSVMSEMERSLLTGLENLCNAGSFDELNKKISISEGSIRGRCVNNNETINSDKNYAIIELSNISNASIAIIEPVYYRTNKTDDGCERIDNEYEYHVIPATMPRWIVNIEAGETKEFKIQVNNFFVAGEQKIDFEFNHSNFSKIEKSNYSTKFNPYTVFSCTYLNVDE